VTDLSQQQIRRRSVLGGLLGEYQRVAQKPSSTPAAEFWNPTAPFPFPRPFPRRAPAQLPRSGNTTPSSTCAVYTRRV
jgi:hypothetical protein